MQFLTTGVESLSRRIALAGLMSRAEADAAILSGKCVSVDGKFVRAGCKVADTSEVVVNGVSVPPTTQPSIWGLIKPRGVIASFRNLSSGNFFTDLLAQWDQSNRSKIGPLALENPEMLNHYIVVNRVPTMATGLVLLTTDGLFSKSLTDPASKILTTYRVRLPALADTVIEDMRIWKHKNVVVGGVSYGPVFIDVEKRTPTQTWLKVRYVERDNSSVTDLLWFKAGVRVNRVNVYAFGPYRASEMPERTVLKFPIHDSIRHLVPERVVKRMLVGNGGVIVQ